MKPRRALAALVTSIVASGLLSAWVYSTGTNAQDPPEPTQTTISVDWDYRPADLSDLTSSSEAVVEAYVTGVVPGEPLQGEAQDSPPIPTQRVSIHVTDLVAGQAPEDLDLFQMGSATDQVDTDPGYAVGEKYLLFIRRRGSDSDPNTPNPDGTWIAVAPDGRLERAGGDINSFIGGPVSDELDGMSTDDAVEQIDPDLVVPPLEDQTGSEQAGQ